MRTITIKHKSLRDLHKKIEEEIRSGEWVFIIENGLFRGTSYVTFKT